MPPRPFPGLAFDNVRDKPLRDIWLNSDAFQALPRHRLDARALPLLRVPRGRLGRLPLPGLAFAGDAALTDPACDKSSLHAEFAQVAEHEASLPPPQFAFRNPRAGAQW